MILKLKKGKERKLNKGGFTLIEVFFSFVIMITISIIVLNMFSTKEDRVSTAISEEKDYYESLKAIARSIYFTSSKNDVDIIIDGHLITKNLTEPNTLYLTSNVKRNADGSYKVETDGKGFELISRNVLGDARITVRKDELLNTGLINISLESYVNGTHNEVQTDSISAVKRSAISSSLTGAYWSLPDEFMTNNIDVKEFSSLLIPLEGTESEELTYGKIYN